MSEQAEHEIEVREFEKEEIDKHQENLSEE